MERTLSGTLSVAQVTHRVRDLLEKDMRLRNIWVSGEVSNVTASGAGHLYFRMAEGDCVLSCVMFRSAIQGQELKKIERGARILAFGSVSVYGPSGQYQLVASRIEAAGKGDLHQQFLALKERLQAEGLFDASHKRGLPEFPCCIGVITSQSGAVVRDILQTLRRRYPAVKVIVSAAQVQGEQAPGSVIAALDLLQKNTSAEIIIIARGGGTFEDLWCFNDERLVRAVYNSKVPVISAIGHETDFTICDFVADLRAATPTAAAELAVPDCRKLKTELHDLLRNITRNLLHYSHSRKQMLDNYDLRLQECIFNVLARKRYVTGNLAARIDPGNLLRQTSSKRQMLAGLQQRLEDCMGQLLQRQRSRLEKFRASIEALEVNAVLKRGYAVVLKDGRRPAGVHDLKPGDLIETILFDGSVQSEIKSVS